MVRSGPLHRAVTTALVMLALAANLASAAEVTARLDRERVVAGETVTLQLVTNDTQQSLETDLSGLQDDFIVLDQRTETQMTIVNGRQAAIVRLLVTLEPRRAGQLQVPPLTFRGGETTPVLTLQVDPAPQLAPGELPPVFIEISLDPQEGPYYVHAQLSLKVIIFYVPNLTEAAINPPAPEQASVRLLDEVPYQADRNGQRYRVLERRYAIFPERSGELIIPAMQLTGRLTEPRVNQLWQPSARGRRVSFQSDPLSLEIKPKPVAFSGSHWLPARRIDLAQQISDAAGLRVGEPVTRTVILDAVGLDEHMLEEPKWPEIVSARIYPDQPQGISRDNGEWVLGHREFRYAVVPEQPGELVLPEIRLPWWDTVADRERVAVLPEHRVQVLPPEQGAVTALPPAMPTSASVAGDGASAARLVRWQILCGVLAVLWLATLALWLRGGYRGGRRAGTNQAAGQTPAEAATLSGLKEACRSGDATRARQMLGRWLRHHGPREATGTLHGLANQADPALALALRELDAAGFSAAGGDGAWQGDALWRAFEAWRKGARSDNGKQGDEFDLFEAGKAGSG